MKKTATLLLLIGITLTTFGQSAINTVATKVVITSAFSKPAIQAYQESSFIKIVDFYTYLTLYSKPETTAALKKELALVLQDLFLTEYTPLVDFTNTNKQKITLNNLLPLLDNKAYTFSLSKVNSKETAVDYWTTSYQLEVQNASKTNSFTLVQKVYFKPITKRFGETSKSVWTIYLGEIE